MTEIGDESGSPASKREAVASAVGELDLWTIEDTPEGLIDSPLDFIFAEHHRQRQAAAILSMVADGEFSRKGVRNLIDFLEGDFSLHVGDEELGFFPLLREQCHEEDNVDALIVKLAAEHKADESICENVVKLLYDVLAGAALNLDAERKVRAFAEHIRQHLALENAILLPLARARMNKESLALMSEILKQRRIRKER